MRIADTKNIDVSNAYCGIGPARYHAYLRVELEISTIRLVKRESLSLGVSLGNELATVCAFAVSRFEKVADSATL